jgi:hypothetical protein
MITDTSPEVEALLLRLRRAQSPAQRLEQVFRTTELAQSFEIGMLRKQHPEATGQRLLFLLAEKRYGRELAERVFGERES